MTQAQARPGITREKVRKLTFEQGLDPRTIALKLGLSVQAVGYHLRKIRSANGASSNKKGAA